MTASKSLMVEAGINAIALSGLATWRVAPEPAFVATKMEAFESSVTCELGRYGRWLRWSWFAIGAETLAKAACLANTDNFPEFNEVATAQCSYLPNQELVESNLVGWAKAYRKDGKAHIFQKDVNVRQYCSYGTLGAYWKTHLPKLAKACSFGPEKIDVLCAGYRLLATVVRNRDVHNYVLGVRQEHFYLVKTVFVPSLNVLLETFPRKQLTGIEVPRLADPT